MVDLRNVWDTGYAPYFTLTAHSYKPLRASQPPCGASWRFMAAGGSQSRFRPCTVRLRGLEAGLHLGAAM